MKKLLAMVLCIAMVLSTMSFTVFADDYVAPERSILVGATPAEVFESEEVTVTITIEGDDIANTQWVLNYEDDYFKLVSEKGYGWEEAVAATNNDSTIEGYHYMEDGTAYANGETVWTYTFEAIAQPDEVTGYFYITNPVAYNYHESIFGLDAVTDTNDEDVPVTIKLRQYGITVEFGEVGSADKDLITDEIEDFPYDDKAYELVVTPEPAADVTYTYYRDGEEVDEIKGKGNYRIEYIVTPHKDGYDEATGSFEFTILAAEYEVEVVEDYVTGKALVLVYTDTDNVFFTYEDDDTVDKLMLDVTVNNYTLNNSGTPHNHVYAYVVEGIAGGSANNFQAYKDRITDIYDGTDLVTIFDYNLNVNNNVEGNTEKADIRDISTVYAVYNETAACWDDPDACMMQILKSDITQDKHVSFDDANLVVEDVYPTNAN